MRLNDIFSDNMILQANKPVYVFGDGKGTVTVEIGGKSGTVVSNDDSWLIELPAFGYGGPYKMTVDFDGDIKELENIYFGDVYLLSGQSNNQFKLWQTNTSKEYYKSNDSLRLFTVDRLEDQGEHYSAKEGWKSAEKDMVGFWPAIGYLLGDELLKQTDRKIGLIACYQGASVIQSWLPEHYLDKTEFLCLWQSEATVPEIRIIAYGMVTGCYMKEC